MKISEQVLSEWSNLKTKIADKKIKTNPFFKENKQFLHDALMFYEINSYFPQEQISPNLLANDIVGLENDTDFKNLENFKHWETNHPLTVPVGWNEWETKEKPFQQNANNPPVNIPSQYHEHFKQLQARQTLRSYLAQVENAKRIKTTSERLRKELKNTNY